MSHLRFSRRMGEQYPYGNEYGCALTRYERHTSIGFWVGLAVGAVAVVLALIYT